MLIKFQQRVAYQDRPRPMGTITQRMAL